MLEIHTELSQEVQSLAQEHRLGRNKKNTVWDGVLERAYSRSRVQPFVAPTVKPSMKYRCNPKNTINVGSVAIKLPATINGQSLTY